MFDGGRAAVMAHLGADQARADEHPRFFAHDTYPSLQVPGVQARRRIRPFNRSGLMKDSSPDDLGHPRGTLAVVALFGLLFAFAWLFTYVFVFLERGAPRH
jgi:hypothetical protein